MSKTRLNTANHDQLLDIIVVGGGINGVGIANDAAGRGLKVGLYEAQDFAGATSSASSKLIHGGLRYLEQYQFRLVSEALSEREILLKKAPHIAYPMRFRLPYQSQLRPKWMLRAGLFLYDHLGKQSTFEKSRYTPLNNNDVLQPPFSHGFEYSDCWVDDARLVILNAIQAQQLGAEVSNYCRVEKAQRENGLWIVQLTDLRSGEQYQRYAKVLVNATGPWVSQFIADNHIKPPPYDVRMVKGSHIIVKRLHQEPYAYMIQNDDDRIIFVIPYLDNYSLIGTTDIEYHGDPRTVSIDSSEKQYLIDACNRYFRSTLTTQEVIADFSGVRPLCDDRKSSAQNVTRDYVLHLDSAENQAPLLSIFGGKLTTYRKLAESALEKLAPLITITQPPWTATAPLSGGNEFQWDANEKELSLLYPYVDKAIRTRWLRAYGSMTRKLLVNVSTKEDLGQRFSRQLYQVEIDFLIESEFVYTIDDLVLRRTKLYLDLTNEEFSNIRDYIEHKMS